MTENNKEEPVQATKPESQKNDAKQNQTTDNGLVQLLEVAKPLVEMFMA
jgi:hypothetical protein